MNTDFLNGLPVEVDITFRYFALVTTGRRKVTGEKATQNRKRQTSSQSRNKSR